MKKIHLKSKMLLAVGLLSSGMAFANQINTQKSYHKADDPLYNWSLPGHASLNNATVAEAIDFFGCSSGTTQCAHGIAVITGDDSVDLKKP